MLTVEDRQCFYEKRFPVSDDGTILLPDNLSFEYIEKVIYNNRELSKQDLRTFGKKTINIKGCNDIVKTEKTARGGYATVIYLVPYEPIRLVKYAGTIQVDKENNLLRIGSCEFIPGDILNIFKDGEFLATVPLTAVNYNSDEEYSFILSCSSDVRDFPETEFEGVINRSVVEKTVCDAPFDGMYVDYLLAKINMFQRDMTAYNQHMVSFNSRLGAYKIWINERCAKDDGKLENWW